jgi:hypothetical protein
MKILISRLLLPILFCLVLSGSLQAAINFEAIDTLPPGEQYRQLSLVLMIHGGAEQQLIEAMASPSPDASANESFDPDAYKTPLTRIVDQESMLNGAAVLLRFAQDSEEQILSKLAQINAESPVLISMVDLNAITEDAIIIRNAIADSISYSGLADTALLEQQLGNYRIRTIKLRNIMEFADYSKELSYLTSEAILSVGGKLDAYQRMFEEEVTTTGFDRQIESAEFIYNRDKDFDKKAAKKTQEIMDFMILSKSKPTP